MAPDLLGRDILWVWEISRGGETLLSYEQTLERIKPGKRHRVMVIIILAAAATLLVTALVLRKSYGAWTS